MTDETPEQKLRTAVMSAWPSITKWEAALDRLCTERYLAGKVAGLRDAGHVIVGRCDLDPPCHRCTMTAEAEAEYAACVAEIREAKHG